MTMRPPIIVKNGERKYVYKWIGPSGHKVWFSFKKLDGSLGKVHMYREANPGNDWKDLDIHIGGRYLKTKGAEYHVHIEALDTDVYVVIT